MYTRSREVKGTVLTQVCSHEEAAASNCDSLIARAMSILPNDPEARLSLASIRMSQSRFDEAKALMLEIYEEIEGAEPCTFASRSLTNPRS